MINKEDIMIASRRRFLLGAGGASAVGLVAAPAIVRVAANMMPISTSWRPDVLEWTASDLTLSVEHWNEHILKPQMIELANQIDALIQKELAADLGWGDPTIIISRPSTSRLLT